MPAAKFVVTTSHGVGSSTGRTADPRSKTTKCGVMGAASRLGGAGNVLAAGFLPEKAAWATKKFGHGCRRTPGDDGGPDGK